MVHFDAEDRGLVVGLLGGVDGRPNALAEGGPAAPTVPRNVTRSHWRRNRVVSSALRGKHDTEG